jgi:rare lipoprotein A
LVAQILPQNHPGQELNTLFTIGMLLLQKSKCVQMLIKNSMTYKFCGISLATLAIASIQIAPAIATPVTPTPKNPVVTPTPAPVVPSDTTTITPPTEKILFTQTGQASWYGSEGGPLTATGERYNPQGMTAAHPTIAFGSKVRVTNIQSGRNALVIINDRGPYAGGRIIDLSAAAAEAVGIKSSGVGKVRIEVLSYGSNKRKGHR